MNIVENAKLLSEFIEYNDPILKEIRETSSELDIALKGTIQALWEKFVSVETPKEETTQSEAQFKVGDEVATLSGEWEDAATVVGLQPNIKTGEIVYTVKKGRKKFTDVEENLFLYIAPQAVSEYSSMSDQELQDELEAMKEIIEIFDDPEEPEQIKAQDAILEIELEIERRKSN